MDTKTKSRNIQVQLEGTEVKGSVFENHPQMIPHIPRNLGAFSTAPLIKRGYLDSDRRTSQRMLTCQGLKIIQNNVFKNYVQDDNREVRTKGKKLGWNQV